MGLIAGTILLWLLGAAAAFAGYVVDGYDDYYGYGRGGYYYGSGDLDRAVEMGRALIGLGATLT
jgi:hypothetical protein